MIIDTVKLLKENLIYQHKHNQTVQEVKEAVQVYFCIILFLKCFMFEKSSHIDELYEPFNFTGICTGYPLILRADWSLCKHLYGDHF